MDRDVPVRTVSYTITYLPTHPQSIKSIGFLNLFLGSMYADRKITIKPAGRTLHLSIQTLIYLLLQDNFRLKRYTKIYNTLFEGVAPCRLLDA